MSNRFTVCVMLKKERYRRLETLSRFGKQECTYPLFLRWTKKSTISRSQITGNPSDVSLTDTSFSSRSFLSRFSRWCCPVGGSAVRRLIEPRTNHEQRANKEKICFCSPEMSQNVTIQIQVICCRKFD